MPVAIASAEDIERLERRLMNIETLLQKSAKTPLPLPQKDEELTTKQAARYLGVSEAYLKKLRTLSSTGKQVRGPEWYRLPGAEGQSKHVRYKKSALDKWLAAQPKFTRTCEEEDKK